MRSPVLLSLLFGAILVASCVTESKAPTVSISGGRLYPPREFQGEWRRGQDRLLFAPPPAPALSLDRAGQRLQFHISAMQRRPDGAWQLNLVPAEEGPAPERRVFRLQGALLYEEDGGEGPGLAWSRAADE